MKKLNLFSIICLYAMSAILSSCGDNLEDIVWGGKEKIDYICGIMTYYGKQDNYSIVKFEGTKIDRPITFYIDGDLNSTVTSDNFAPETRIMMDLFITPAVDELPEQMTISRENILTCFAIETLSPEICTQLPLEEWNDEPDQYIASIYRSGPYLDIFSYGPDPTSLETGRMKFYVDPGSLNQENIISYLSHVNTSTDETAELIYSYTNCIDITSLMNGRVKNLIIIVNNVNEKINDSVPYGGLESGYKSITIPLEF